MKNEEVKAPKSARLFDVICTLGTILGGAFIWGKLNKFIDWPWWAVLSPIIILALAALAAVIFYKLTADKNA